MLFAMQSVMDSAALNTISYVLAELILRPDIGELNHLYPTIPLEQSLIDHLRLLPIHVSSFLGHIVGDDATEIILEYANDKTTLYPVVMRPNIGGIYNPNFTHFRSIGVCLCLAEAALNALDELRRVYGESQSENVRVDCSSVRDYTVYEYSLYGANVQFYVLPWVYVIFRAVLAAPKFT
jgi:hypothetical protein